MSIIETAMSFGFSKALATDDCQFRINSVNGLLGASKVLDHSQGKHIFLAPI